MRKTFLSLAVLALAAFGASAASASAASTTCATEGSIKLSPGLSTTPTVQNVSIKGTLTGCKGVENSFTGGKFNAHFKTAEPVTCAILTGTGAAGTESNIIAKWTPSGEGNSMGTFSLPLTEVAGASLGGLIASGPFTAGAITGTVSQTYTGGPKCGLAEGKKKAKKVNKGTFTGTLSV